MVSNAFNSTNLSGLTQDFQSAQTFVSAKFDPAGGVSFNNDATVESTLNANISVSAPQI